MEKLSTKCCSRCKQNKSTNDFFLANRKTGALQAYCKACQYEYRKENNERSCQWVKNHYNKNKQKDKARRAVRAAVKKGTLHKPDHCTVCGQHFPSRQIEGHHDDYNKMLDVVWCCKSCHNKIHEQIDLQKAI